MNHEKASCQSCSMPIESGIYCQYCADEEGNLHAFEEQLARMTQFMRRQNPSLSAAESERRTLEYMSQMPAWRNHPDLLARLDA